MEEQLTTLEKTYNEPILEINGGHSLNGTIEIDGAKNAALPAMVAALLSDETVELLNAPTELNDIKRIIELMKSMGTEIKVDRNKKSLHLNGSNWSGGELDGKIAGSIRHSLLLLGLSVAWGKNLKLPIPGGCKLGSRKHDMHVDALRELGNTVVENGGIEVIYDDSDKEVDINFYYPTFGGTFNAIFASVKKDGTTTRIHNAAKNPEVIDVISMLTGMGADIQWETDRTLIINGVKKLSGTKHSVMPDRIVGATVIVATGVTKGMVKIKNFNEELLSSEISVWRKTGLVIKQEGSDLMIDATASELKSVDIETKAYPGFHTDVQPLHGLLMTLSSGKSSIKETILDGRFEYCEELMKLGANINVTDGDFTCVNGAAGQIAEVTGVEKLYGNLVKATDIRGGAAVALAGMAAEGTTIVTNLYQLERGYGTFVEMFNSLGADIDRINAKKKG